MQDLSTLKIQSKDPWKDPKANGWDVIDGRQERSDRTLEADVVIVGSGAGGGVSAEILSQKGLKVILVEAARLKSSDEFNLNEAEAYHDLYQEGGMRATKDGTMSIMQGRAVGGTTVVNWTSSFRTPVQTLDFWRDEFGVQGMDEAAMAPWFAQMEKRLKVMKWVAHNNNNQIMLDACQSLGWQADAIPRNVSGCWNLGYCGMGCPTNAKQSMLVTTIPAAMDAGATLLHSAQADTLIMEGDKVTGVRIKPLDDNKIATGATLTLKASTVIVSGGSIQSPALLLRSQVPDPHERVGKRTFTHPTSFAFGIFDREIAPYYGAPQSVYCDEFSHQNGIAGNAGYKMEMMALHPGMVGAFVAGFGQQAWDEISQLPHMGGAIAMIRDGFHEQSQGGAIELRDNGEPVIDYPINEYVLEGTRRAHLSMVEMFFAAGAKKVRPSHSQADYYTSWKDAQARLSKLAYVPVATGIGCAHVMGGLAMGSDESQCVVNSDGSYKYLDGLYVMDGSVFPTSVGANPQLSIYGVSARNATLLADKLKA